MKLVPDASRRFSKRPHYEPYELDEIAESLISAFLEKRRGAVVFPITTDDLTVLIEEHVDDLDTHADLSVLGVDIEGVTDFQAKGKPRVRISVDLWSGQHRENRLRTTLTHELGHVHLHNYLFQLDGILELFADSAQGRPQQCRRDAIEGRTRDWMEWQASYFSGALLMPSTAFRTTIAESGIDVQAGPLPVEGAEAQRLIETVGGTFQVSKDAARVRLSQSRYVSADPEHRLSL